MKKVYLVRRSWVDETSELARCSDFDLAVSICQEGYNVYDEDGNLLFTALNQNRYVHGKGWVEIKSKLENLILKYTRRFIPIIKGSEFHEIIDTLNEVLKLMNKVEIEDAKAAKNNASGLTEEEMINYSKNYTNHMLVFDENNKFVDAYPIPEEDNSQNELDAIAIPEEGTGESEDE